MSSGQSQTDRSPLLKALGLTKAFGATVALQSFDFTLTPGQIHALVGENGAGKSTFIKVLAGIHQPDAGSLEIVSSGDGHPAIAFIHQDLGLIPDMSAAENVLLGSDYPHRGGLIDWSAVHRLARESLARVGATFSPNIIVDQLAIADRALVAIARAIRLKARILVLDEPTATLPGNDVHKLFEVLNQLKGDGIGMIYVSHRLREILAIADVVTVMRDGRRCFHGSAKGLSEADLVDQMIGRAHSATPPREATPRAPTQAVVRVDGMSSGVLGATSIVVNAGEIVGCVGLRGAGQEAIGRALVGIERFSGSVDLLGRAYQPKSVSDALRRGVAFVSGNREMSIVRTMTVLENLFINPRFTPLPNWFRSSHAERIETERVLNVYDVRPRATAKPIGELSGGNAQKIVFARGLESSPVLVVLDDPTAGVDMPTRFALYDFMRAKATEGVAFLITSSDHDEVASVCDRIHVFRGGRVAATLDRPPFDPEQIAARVSEEVE
jgi:ribose transport system ATP-binding protein